MRLAKATFEKVGPFKDFSIEFKKNKRKDLAEVHILTGPNGSGKSTILRGLSFPFNMSQPKANFFHSFWTSGRNGSTIRVIDETGDKISISSSGPNSSLPIIVSPMRDSEVSFAVYQEKASGYRSSDTETSFEYGVFGYSGHRFLNEDSYLEMSGSASSSNSSGERHIWHLLRDAVNFDRSEREGMPLESWVANILNKAAYAAHKKDKVRERAARETISRFEKMVAEVTGRTIEFDMNLDSNEAILKLDDKNVDLRVLPDGLKSIFSWLGDLLMRMESIPWKKKQSIFDQPIILFLDEIDIHLHPSWQMKILPIIQKTFVNAQIFVSTHSPFVVASVEDAYVYDLNIGKDGYAYLEQPPVLTEKGQSYVRVLQEVFDIEGEFVDSWSRENLKAFNTLVQKTKSRNSKTYSEAHELGEKLASHGIELRDIVSISLNQLERRISKPIE